MSVRDRYLVGKLAPKDTFLEEDQNDELDIEGEDEGERELDASRSQTLVPSSIGFTFCIDGDVRDVELEVRWGRYERGDSETEVSEKTGKPVKAWKRIPSGGKMTLLLEQGTIEPFPVDTNCPEVLVQGTVRPRLPKGIAS